MSILAACTKDSSRDPTRGSSSNVVPVPTTISVTDGGLSVAVPTASKTDGGK